MVVEDTALLRDTVARYLRLQGFSTVCAANGLEALAALGDAVPDLILLDIMMPEMDGLECLIKLRRDPRARETPVIMMSALGNPEQKERARQLGAQEYLVKAPFSAEELMDRINRCMSGN
jgi:CheY-like chemotaxis protein